MLPIAVFAGVAGVALALLVQAFDGAVGAPRTGHPVQPCPLRAVVALWTQDAQARQLAVVARWTVVAVDRVGVVHLSRGGQVGVRLRARAHRWIIGF